MVVPRCTLLLIFPFWSDGALVSIVVAFSYGGPRVRCCLVCWCPVPWVVVDQCHAWGLSGFVGLAACWCSFASLGVFPLVPFLATSAAFAEALCAQAPFASSYVPESLLPLGAASVGLHVAVGAARGSGPSLFVLWRFWTPPICLSLCWLFSMCAPLLFRSRFCFCQFRASFPRFVLGAAFFCTLTRFVPNVTQVAGWFCSVWGFPKALRWSFVTLPAVCWPGALLLLLVVTLCTVFPYAGLIPLFLAGGRSCSFRSSALLLCLLLSASSPSRSPLAARADECVVMVTGKRVSARQ